MNQRLPALLGLMVTLLAASGCIVVIVPMRKKVAGAAHPPQLSFKAGTTRREDVLKALEGLETEVSGPTYFWARWNESASGLGVAYGAATPQGVGGGGVGGARLWDRHNFLASFDQDGVLKNYRTCWDDELLYCIDQTIVESAMTDRVEEVTLQFQRRRKVGKPSSVRYEVEPTTIRFEDVDQGVQAQAPISGLRYVSLEEAEFPAWVRVAIGTKDVPRIPKRLVGDVSPREIWNLRRLLRLTRPDLNPRPKPAPAKRR